MKFAFVHIMRTSGAYAVNQCAAAGLQLHCPWAKGLRRDWNRAELFSLAEEQSGLIHNHVLNWDSETLAAVKAAGWRTFTIVRDPCEQLPSLWSFIGAPGSFDDFIHTQLAGRPTIVSNDDPAKRHHTSWRNWSVPWWWPLIDTIVPYKTEMFRPLMNSLGLVTKEVKHENSSQSKPILTPELADAIKRSSYYQTYLEASQCALSRTSNS